LFLKKEFQVKVRIVSKGWESYTGSLGFRAVFKDGVSVDDLDTRQVARIGSNLTIIDVETGLQVGPSVAHLNLQPVSFRVAEVLVDQAQEDRTVAFDRDKLAAEVETRKATDAAALADAQRKAQEQFDADVVYSRVELEAIGANDGIAGLRAISTPLGVKGRGIAELVNEILAAQAQRAVA
jgi:hypothetical protein